MRPAKTDTRIGLYFKGKIYSYKDDITLNLISDNIGIQILYKRISK